MCKCQRLIKYVWTFDTPSLSPPHVKALAAAKAMQCALSIEMRQLAIFKDAKVIMEDICTITSSSPSPMESVIRYAQALLVHFDSWTVLYIPGTNNFLSYNLAYWANKMEISRSRHF